MDWKKELKAALNRKPGELFYQHLELNTRPVGDAGAKIIAAAMPDSQIINLRLENCGLTGAGVAHLATIFPRSKIIELWLCSNHIEGKDLKPLLKSLADYRLQRLELSNNPLGNAGAEAIARDMPKRLQILCLESCNIDDDGVEALAAALPHCGLFSLHLGGNPISEKGAQALLHYLPYTNITNFSFSHDLVNPKTVQQIRDVLEVNSKLKIKRTSPPPLPENFPPIGERTLYEPQLVADISEMDSWYGEFCKTLREGADSFHNISCSNFRDAGAALVAASLPNSHLTNLSLLSCGIGDAGAAAIARKLPHSMLTSLNLGLNHIKDDGILAIAEQLPHSSLTTLNLSSNHIGEKGIKALAETLPHTRIQELLLSGNYVGDAGARALKEVLPRTHITHLALDDKGIDPSLLNKINKIVAANKKREESAPMPLLEKPAPQISCAESEVIFMNSVLQQRTSLSRSVAALSHGQGL